MYLVPNSFQFDENFKIMKQEEQEPQQDFKNHNKNMKNEDVED